MYVAGYELDDSVHLSVAACTWRIGSGGLAPAALLPLLRSRDNVDVVLRVNAGPSQPASAVLFASVAAPGDSAAAVREFMGRVAALALPGVSVVSDAASFDALSAHLPAWQLSTEFGGFRHGDVSIACPFSLDPFVANTARDGDMVYQLHLRRRGDDAELQRAARKHAARLQADDALPAQVRTLQADLLRRLLVPGEFAVETLAFPSAGKRAEWRGRIAGFFAETAARYGFRDLPLAETDDVELLATGVHPWTFSGMPTDPAELAAHALDDDGVAATLTRVRLPATGQAGAGATRAPAFFLSHASPDFRYAETLCSALEAAGIDCWIAPRDINSTLMSYPEAIAAAIANCRCLVVVLSDAANESIHVPREIDMALARRIPIIPIRIQDVPPRGQLDYMLRTCQWLDAFNRPADAVVAELRQRTRDALAGR